MKAAAWQQVTGPMAEPLSVGEMKEHLRVETDDEDALLADYISAARAWCETHMGRALLAQTWQAHFHGWPLRGELELPMPPLQSVTWVQYTNEEGVAATVDPSVYRIVTAHEPGCIVLAPGAAWPSATLDAGLPVVVQYVCGYATAAAVPEQAKQAMRWLVGHMTENREAVSFGNVMPQQVPMTVRWALDPLRLRYIW